MRLYLDSAERDAITEALATGFVFGVTTNPTLLRRAGVRASDVPALARFALAAGAREIHLQTYAEEAGDITAEGRTLAALDPERVVVKIPATAPGFAAAARLAADGLRVTLTAVYTVRQVLLAQAVGAAFVAVYVGRMRDSGADPPVLIGQMQRMIAAQGSNVHILAASVRDPGEVDMLGELGVPAVTLPLALLRRLPESEQTQTAADTFGEDARALG